MPHAAAAWVGRGLAAGLDYAHRRLRVAHRDVKPANVLLSRAGAVKVRARGRRTEGSPGAGRGEVGCFHSLSPVLPGSLLPLGCCFFRRCCQR